MGPSENLRRRVGLFTTCLVESFRPAVGYAAIRLLEQAGCRVEVPEAQHCCGRPALQADDLDDLRGHAERVIDTFESYDFVVAPSPSCASVLKRYAALLASKPEWAERTARFSEKAYELTAFLADVMQAEPGPARVDASIALHDSCTALGELGIREQPRALLSAVEGVALRELPGAAKCCGFGASACASSSAALTGDIREAGAGMLVSSELGCLLGIARKLKRDGSAIEVRHIAEVLAGMNETPPIGGATRQIRT